VFYGVSSVCIRDAEGLGVCELRVLLIEEVGGVGDSGSGDTAVVHTEAVLGGFFEHVCEICQIFCSWDYFPQLLKDQDFWSTRFCIERILLYIQLCNSEVCIRLYSCRRFAKTMQSPKVSHGKLILYLEYNNTLFIMCKVK
jgi:hypothetical protein